MIWVFFIPVFIALVYGALSVTIGAVCTIVKFVQVYDKKNGWVVVPIFMLYFLVASCIWLFICINWYKKKKS